MEERSSTRRPRRGLVTIVLVLATLIGFVGSFAVWSARQLLETDQWTQTSSELLEDEEIRDAVATFLVDSLFANVDVESQIAGALPPRLAPLAGPAAGGLRQLANQVAPRLLEQPRVQALWEDINRAAHERFLAVVNGDAPALSESGGEVYLDLGVLVQQLGANLGIGAASKVPAGVAQLAVMSADDLEVVQDGAGLLEDAAYVLAALFFLLLALAVFLARGWRRVAIRSCGFSFLVIGILILVFQDMVGTAVVEALAPTAAAQPAAESTWDIATSFLSAMGVAMIGYGVAIVLGAWLAGPGAAATATRRSITPFLHERRVLYPILLAIVLLVFVWSPTEGTRRLIPSLVLIALLVGGAEALRRQALAEFPGATLEVWSQRWRERFEGMRHRAQTTFEGRRSDAAADEAARAEDRIARLERLAELHSAGVIDDEELAEEKALIRG